jgi:hypothetical protein
MVEKIGAKSYIWIMVLGAIMSRESLDILEALESLEGLETLQAKSREAWHTI